MPFAAVGFALDRVALRRFYARDHLDQVLATFALILFFNELVRVIWGAKPYYMETPSWLSGGIELLPGMVYPSYRLAIVAAGLALGGLLYGLIAHTRIGMRICAGASNREMVAGLGVDIDRLSSMVYVGAAGLAGLAGILTGPILAIEVGMGEQILILTFVVIVIGGLGSIRGAFVASVVVGIADACGRFLLPQILGFTLGPALSSMAIYILMAAVLVWRPQGLLAAKSG